MFDDLFLNAGGMLMISNGRKIDPSTIADTRSMPLNSSVNLVGSPSISISRQACVRLLPSAKRIKSDGKAHYKQIEKKIRVSSWETIVSSTISI